MSERIRLFNPEATVSALNTRTGERRSASGYARSPGNHANGSIKEAIEEALGVIERNEGPWIVEAISWPARILRDIRNCGNPVQGGLPETNILKQMGRQDLLPPHRRGRARA